MLNMASTLGWLHTGDLGYYDDAGEIFLVDRMSEFINYRAIKIPPAELEALIQQHPAVLEVAVVAMPHAIEEEHAMAFIAKVPGKEVITLTNMRTCLNIYQLFLSYMFSICLSCEIF